MPVAVPDLSSSTRAAPKQKLIDVEDVLSRLTLHDKVSLLSGKDGPNGCRGTKFFEGVPAACFPCATGLASSWDVALLEKVGVSLGDECKAKGVHVLLAPTVNMHRTPLNGRGFESFSEDPLLSGKLAGSVIRGCQSTGVGAALKHLVCNDQETNRYSISAEVNERALREIYLKPFEIAIQEAQPWVVMTSYNRVNGVHASETKSLVTGILREEWGWDGLVVSDWHGTYSTDGAINAGVDLEMPGPSIIRGPALLRMVTCGKVTVDEIDQRARQVLRLANRVSRAGIPSEAEERENPFPAYDIMRQAAADAIVLLKNDRNVLPISPDVRKVAVIGPNAMRAEISGGGSAALRPTYTVSPLDGVRAAAGPSTQVNYAAGCDSHKLTPLIGESMRNSCGQPGFDISFYNDLPSRGTPAIHTITTTNSNMFFNDNLPQELNKACYALAIGQFTPDSTGTYEFGVGALGTADLYLDNVLLIDNSTAPVPGELFYGKGSREELAEIHLEAGRSYDIRVEYASPSASTSFVGPLALSSRGGLRFGGYLKLSPEQHLEEAVQVAQDADVVILVVGLNAEFETEGFDRADMRLPTSTLTLIERVMAVRPDTVICVQSGTPIEMPFASRASTLLHFFYNGNETGNGLADVLFGKVNPSGKLPYTSAEKLEDYASHAGSASKEVSSTQSFPGVDRKVHYHEGVFVGYRQFASHGPPPAFAFGHGLSYTTFQYEDCQVNSTQLTDSSKIVVQCTTRNTGSRAGREIVQIYISGHPTHTHDDPSFVRPARELKAFTKSRLLAVGESQVLEMELDRTAFAYYHHHPSGADSEWRVDKGQYAVEFAASSIDIRHQERITVDADFSF